MHSRILRFLLSLSAAALLMALLVTFTSQDSPQRLLEMAGGVLPQGFIQGFTYFLFFFGISEVLNEAHSLSGERDTLPAILLPDTLRGLSCQDALTLAADRLEVLRTRMSGRTAFIRYVCWAIPSVGFIGTVIGISAALGHAGKAATAEGLDYITTMLCVAFDTTLVALLLVIILNFLQHLIEKRQEEFIAEAGAYLNENITDRIGQAAMSGETSADSDGKFMGKGTSQEVSGPDGKNPLHRYRTITVVLSAAVLGLCWFLLFCAARERRPSPAEEADYLNAVADCRRCIEAGSDSNFVALIDARELLAVVEEYENKYDEGLPGGVRAAVLNSFLSPKLSAAAGSWAAAAASQDTLGETERAHLFSAFSEYLSGTGREGDTTDYRSIKCYLPTREKGVSLLSARKYVRAQSFLSVAGTAPDLPVDNDIDSLIEVCRTRAEAAKMKKTTVADTLSGQILEVDTAEEAGAAVKDSSTLCMEILDVLFANAAAKGRLLGDYGDSLRAAEVCYLKPKVLYRSTVSEDMTLELYCRLIAPGGRVIRGRKSPDGFTSAGKYMILPGDGRELLLPGWGSRYPGFYSPGSYRYEIWCGEKMVFAREFGME